MTMKQHFKGAIPIVGCLFWLAACSSSHTAPAASAPPASTPPDSTALVTQLQAAVTSGDLPTLDLATSVTGTDADHNGIRDDIDALIAKQADMPVQRAALSQVAQSIQATLTLDATNATATAAVALNMRKAIACLFTQYDGQTATGRFHWLQEVSINTMPRLQAYDHFNIAMNNSATPMATGTVCNAA
jgi:hypothetical protein